jgi:hypothetical protein
LKFIGPATGIQPGCWVFHVSLFGGFGRLGVALYARHQIGKRHDPGFSDHREFLHRGKLFCLSREGLPKQIAKILRPVVGAKRSVFLLFSPLLCLSLFSLSGEAICLRLASILLRTGKCLIDNDKT